MMEAGTVCETLGINATLTQLIAQDFIAFDLCKSLKYRIPYIFQIYIYIVVEFSL
jgi:hypothetical protein